MAKMTYEQVRAFDAYKAEVEADILAAVSSSSGNTTGEEDQMIADAVLRRLIDREWLNLPEYEEE